MATSFPDQTQTVDRVKGYVITLPKAEMTLHELANPVEHGYDRFLHCDFVRTEYWDDVVVRFPARRLTVGTFIAAIEAQTPLRHRFRHCGNGSTILWGGDCSFGLSFATPKGTGPPPLLRGRAGSSSPVAEVERNPGG